MNILSFLEVSQTLKIHLGSEIPAPLQSKVGVELEIGIRPENIITLEERTSDCKKVSLNVIGFENMGNEQLIYLNIQDQSIIARRNAQESVEIGSTLFIHFPPDKILYLNSP